MSKEMKTEVDREQAKRELKMRLPDYLREKGIDPDGAFRCLSPDHPDKHPSMNMFTFQDGTPKVGCHSRHHTFDIIDLIEMDYGLSTGEAMQWGFNHYGIHPDQSFNNSRTATTTHYRKEKNKKDDHVAHDRQNELAKEILPSPDFSDQVELAHRILLQAKNENPYTGQPINTPEIFYSYLRDKRGVTEAQIKEYKIGFSPSGINGLIIPHLGEPVFLDYAQKRNKDAYYGSTANTSHKLILPNIDPDGKCHYFYSEITDRRILNDPKVGQYAGGKYLKPKALKQKLFNDRYLKSENPPEIAIICEGFYDALAYERAGLPAIGLIGVGYKEFETLLKKYRPKTHFVIALDNDATGQERAKKFTDLLDELEYSYEKYVLDFAKDADEGWQADPDRLIRDVEYIQKNAPVATNPEKLEEYNKGLEKEYAKELSPFYHLGNFIDDIIQSKNDQAIPTGIDNLDAILDGGLYSGLYAIGALSSLGKTTFCVQLMDNIAKSGQDVLFFSLEMSRKELMSKSISRLTLDESIKAYGDQRYARSTREIMTGSKYKGLSKNHIETIYKAVESYEEFAGNIYIIEAEDDFSYEDVDRAIERHVMKTGRRPVVFIDYLQILDPPVGMERATQKDNMDKTVKVLKHLSRDYDIPVIAISSFNRSNYDKPVKGMDSFKESGGIEYSCDFCIILDYLPVEAKDKAPVAEKRYQTASAGESFPIVCRVEKNRNGRKGPIYLDFFPKFNFYRPSRAVK